MRPCFEVGARMQQYRSLHPNHAHQLMVSASKHYYLSKDGLTLKCQKKPMEVTLAKAAQAERRHMVIYTLRDHCSAVRYAEVGFGPQLPSLRAFLARAWGKKASSPFCGLPVVLTFPQTAHAAFPGVLQAVQALGVEVSAATSGFQGGVRDPLEVEKTLAYFIDKPISEALQWLAKAWVLNSEHKHRTGGASKIDFWSAHAPPITLAPDDWAVANEDHAE